MPKLIIENKTSGQVTLDSINVGSVFEIQSSGCLYIKGQSAATGVSRCWSLACNGISDLLSSTVVIDRKAKLIIE